MASIPNKRKRREKGKGEEEVVSSLQKGRGGKESKGKRREGKRNERGKKEEEEREETGKQEETGRRKEKSAPEWLSPVLYRIKR